MSVPVWSSGVLMSRRVSGVVACALALSLSVSACSGGAEDTPAAGSTKAAAASATPSEAPYGEPAVASDAEALAALQDYNRRNNAVIVAFRKPPYTLARWKTVDGGAILAEDAYDTRAAAHGFVQPDNRWVFQRVVKVYAPPSKTWPKEMLVAADSRVLKRPPDAPRPDRRFVGLGRFVQPAEGAPWLHVASGYAVRARLPQPAPAGPEAIPTDADRARAVELAQELPAYWSGGTAPAGFAGTKFIDQPRTYRTEQLKRGIHRDIKYDVRLLDGPDSVHAYRAQGGVLVLASYRSTVTFTAVTTLFWTEASNKAVWGAQARPVLRRTEVVGATFFVPDSGKARPLGYYRNDALFGGAAQ